jgi:hypothetical protein
VSGSSGGTGRLEAFEEELGATYKISGYHSDGYEEFYLRDTEEGA